MKLTVIWCSVTWKYARPPTVWLTGLEYSCQVRGTLSLCLVLMSLTIPLPLTTYELPSSSLINCWKRRDRRHQASILYSVSLSCTVLHNVQHNMRGSDRWFVRLYLSAKQDLTECWNITFCGLTVEHQTYWTDPVQYTGCYKFPLCCQRGTSPWGLGSLRGLPV